jgi:hypothetical protein
MCKGSLSKGFLLNGIFVWPERWVHPLSYHSGRVGHLRCDAIWRGSREVESKVGVVRSRRRPPNTTGLWVSRVVSRRPWIYKNRCGVG